MQMLYTKANKVHFGRWLLPKTLNAINHIGHSYDVLLAGCLCFIEFDQTTFS